MTKETNKEIELSLKEIIKEKKFDKDQLEEIRLGLEDGLNINEISIFARPEYNWFQMMLIRTGIHQNIDVFQYADPSLSCLEMIDIKLSLLKK